MANEYLDNLAARGLLKEEVPRVSAGRSAQFWSTVDADSWIPIKLTGGAAR